MSLKVKFLCTLLSTSGSNLLSVGMFVYWCRETVEVWVEGKACEEIVSPPRFFML